MQTKMFAAAIATAVLFTQAAYGDTGHDATAPVSAHTQISQEQAVPAAQLAITPARTQVAAVQASASSTLELTYPDITVTKPKPKPKPKPVAQYVTAPSAGRQSGASGYTFNVPLAGHQQAIDRCDGFVWEDFGKNGTAVSAHNYCGGAVVLKLDVGDKVRLTGYGEGTYKVTRVKTVPKGSPASVLDGGLWMQTCTYGKSAIRLVGLTRAS